MLFSQSLLESSSKLKVGGIWVADIWLMFNLWRRWFMLASCRFCLARYSAMVVPIAKGEVSDGPGMGKGMSSVLIFCFEFRFTWLSVTRLDSHRRCVGQIEAGFHVMRFK